MSSYPSDVESDKILEDITKMSHRDPDDELKRKHVEIKDEFRKVEKSITNCSLSCLVNIVIISLTNTVR